jgi:prepilin-type N-terminal cleavage/methylation domain-containing protein
MNPLACTKPLTLKRAFSLLEVLVAMAILSLMMVFLFNLVGQTMRAWEGGSRQIEAAQAARMGLETMARDLQYSFGGSAVVPPLQVGGALKTNIIPFFSANNSAIQMGIPANLPVAPSSGQIFTVGPLASETNQLSELGYTCAYVTRATAGEGYDDMRGRRYVLLRHAIPGTNTGVAEGSFFYTEPPPADPTSGQQWFHERTIGTSNAVTTRFRHSVIPNCYQLRFQYASNNGGVLAWSTNWNSQTNTPAGVLVTAKVMDEKTAARIAVLRSNGLTAADVADDATSDVARILREGTVEVHRFIPMVNSRQ